MEKPTVEDSLAFQELLLKFRSVKRRLFIPKTNETENDVDHSYFLTMIAWWLAPQINPSLDGDKIRRYALLHDFVETHAGDTFAFDELSRQSKKQREAEALLRLEDELKANPELTETIKAYEAQQDEESRFVYALDKMMPAFLSVLDEGRVWKDEGLSFAKVHEYDSAKTSVSADVTDFFNNFYEYLESHPEFFAD